MKYINILGIQYSIEIISASELIKQLKETNLSYDEILEEIGQKGEHFAGLCDNDRCQIWVNSDINNKEKMKKIIIHEIIESCVSEGLIDIDHVSIQSITNGLFTSGLMDKSVEDIMNEVMQSL